MRTSKFRSFGVAAIAGASVAILGMSAMRAFASSDQEFDTIFPTTQSQNPVLVYDVTGSTLAGMIHLRLSVYDTGHATMSSVGFNVFEPLDDKGCPNDGRADFAWVGPEAAKQLQEDLKAAGAFRATNGGMALDTPLNTVTVFSYRSGLARAHTFTYHFSSTPEIEQTAIVINQFIDEYFPGY